MHLISKPFPGLFTAVRLFLPARACPPCLSHRELCCMGTILPPQQSSHFCCLESNSANKTHTRNLRILFTSPSHQPGTRSMGSITLPSQNELQDRAPCHQTALAWSRTHFSLSSCLLLSETFLCHAKKHLRGFSWRCLINRTAWDIPSSQTSHSPASPFSSQPIQKPNKSLRLSLAALTAAC